VKVCFCLNRAEFAVMKPGPQNDMKTRGIERWTGLIMVGDGLAGLIWPAEYLRKLKIGPEPMNDVLEALAERPELTRVLCAIEVAVGAWVFTR
jgi:hypothetical protein